MKHARRQFDAPYDRSSQSLTSLVSIATVALMALATAENANGQAKVEAGRGIQSQPSDPNFLTPTQKPGSFTIRPTESAWIFIGDSAVQANGSAWGYAKSPVAGTTQTASLQNNAKIQQTMAWSAGPHTVTVWLQHRLPYANRPVTVTVEGVTVATFTPTAQWTQFTTPTFAISVPGRYTLTFSTTNHDKLDGATGIIGVIINELPLDSKGAFKVAIDKPFAITSPLLNKQPTKSEPLAIANLRRGNEAYNNGDYKKTAELITHVVDRELKGSAKNLVALKCVALSLRSAANAKLGKYDQALNDVNEAIRLGPSRPSLHRLRAVIYAGLGDSKLAEVDRAEAANLQAKNEHPIHPIQPPPVVNHPVSKKPSLHLIDEKNIDVLQAAGFTRGDAHLNLEPFVRFGSKAVADKYHRSDAFRRIEIKKETKNHQDLLRKQVFRLEGLRIIPIPRDDIETNGLLAELQFPMRIRGEKPFCDDIASLSGILFSMCPAEANLTQFAFLTKSGTLEQCSAAEAQVVRSKNGYLYHPERANTTFVVRLDDDFEILKDIGRHPTEYRVEAEVTDLRYERPSAWGYFQRRAYFDSEYDCEHLFLEYERKGKSPQPVYFATLLGETTPEFVWAQLKALRIVNKSGKVIGEYNPAARKEKQRSSLPWARPQVVRTERLDLSLCRSNTTYLHEGR